MNNRRGQGRKVTPTKQHDVEFSCYPGERTIGGGEIRGNQCFA